VQASLEAVMAALRQSREAVKAAAALRAVARSASLDTA
jgi:hypothetical protein